MAGVGDVIARDDVTGPERGDEPGGMSAPARSTQLLEIDDLRIEHRADSGQTAAILTGVDLTVAKGETVGIVGESGSGKSMLAKAVIRLLPRNVYAAGRAWFKGVDVLALGRRQMDALRGGGITILYQDPFTMLNPLLTCGDHIAEGLPGGAPAAIGGAGCASRRPGAWPRWESTTPMSWTAIRSSSLAACASG